MKMFRFFDPARELNFVRFFPASLVIAGILPIVVIIASLMFGINWGIDFSGGTEMQIQFSKEVQADEIRSVLENLGFEKHQVQSYGPPSSHEMLVRVERLSTFKPEDISRIRTLVVTKLGVGSDVSFNDNIGDRISVKLKAPEADLALQQQALAKLLNEQSGFKLRESSAILRDEPKDGFVNYSVLFVGVSDKIAKALSDKFGQVDVRRVEFVDGQVSKQLRTDGALAVFYAILAILIYLAIRFDFFFAPGAVVALVQDTFGAFLVFVMGRYEFDLPSIAALLTVVGVSINNTVVVYDRIRETLPAGKNRGPDDEQVTACVNKAINDTMSRTINTTLTVLFSSVSLWIFAGGVIKSFAIVLTIGLALGAFSSTLAAPASYLFLRRHFGNREDPFAKTDRKTHISREEKARGVV